MWVCVCQEPDEQEAPDDQDASPPEDTSLYPHSPGTTQFQQVRLEGLSRWMSVRGPWLTDPACCPLPNRTTTPMGSPTPARLLST